MNEPNTISLHEYALYLFYADEAGFEPTRSALQTDALPLELFVLIDLLFYKPNRITT